MHIGSKLLHRRAMLMGGGAAIALPLLDAMTPPTIWRRSAAEPPIRFVAFEMVHGSAGSTNYGRERHLWLPAESGRGFAMTPILQPLAPFRNELTIISDISVGGAGSRDPSEDGPGVDHARSSACFLTGAHPRRGSGSFVGASIDQIYARHIRGQTPVQSLQLGIEEPGDSGNGQPWPEGYDPSYRHCISWSDAETPLRPERRLSAIFARLFGRTPLRADDVNGSILDRISDSSARLRRNLSTQDRERIDAHLAMIRDVERRIAALEDTPAAAMPFSEHVRLLGDLLLLAFAADITRIATVKLGMDRSQRIYSESGVDRPFHALSHHSEEPDKIEAFARLNAFHVQQFAHFVGRLHETPDGDSNLLHQSVALYGSPMGDSHVHAHDFVPLVLAGRAGGRIAGGQHIVAAASTPIANVLLTVAHSLGMETEQMGDSSGPVSL
jgi:hypothetical protein